MSNFQCKFAVFSHTYEHKILYKSCRSCKLYRCAGPNVLYMWKTFGGVWMCKTKGLKTGPGLLKLSWATLKFDWACKYYLYTCISNEIVRLRGRYMYWHFHGVGPVRTYSTIISNTAWAMFSNSSLSACLSEVELVGKVFSVLENMAAWNNSAPNYLHCSTSRKFRNPLAFWNY